MECYKVVRRWRNKLVSCTAYRDAQVEYAATAAAEAPGWLREKGYHLLAFDLERDAVAFCGLDALSNWEIWRANGEGKVLLPSAFLNVVGLAGGEMRVIDRLVWPYGTVCYETITLVEKVWPK